MPEKPVKDLRSYLAYLEHEGKLKTIKEPLSPILEIPGLLRRIMYSKGPTVLFTNIKDHEGWRIAGNIFSNLEILKKTLGVENLEEIGYRLVGSLLQETPKTFTEKLRALKEASSLAKMMPKTTRSAEFTHIKYTSKDSPLDILPAFKTWPRDASRYLTFPLVITRDPETGSYNMGVYRVMLLDGETGVIHWQIHKRGARDYMLSQEEKIPVAIAIGSDPGTLFTGVAPVPPPMDKYLFAGIVRGEALSLYKLPNGLLVPANAEVVLEGYVLRGETSREGPFGDHWGYYDEPVEEYPVFHVERMYTRRNPVYYGSVVGLPALEDAVIGKAIERVFLPLLKFLIPDIVEVNFPVHGVFQGAMIVSIRKRYPGHAKQVMNALWGLGQTSLTKIIIVVDQSINPHNICQVIWAVSSNVDPDRDILIIDDAHTDMLDPAKKAPGLGGKLGIDATIKLPEENNNREWPKLVSEPEELKKYLDSLYMKIFHENPQGPFDTCTIEG